MGPGVKSLRRGREGVAGGMMNWENRMGEERWEKAGRMQHNKLIIKLKTE